MARFTESQLRDKALLALREAYEQAQTGPIPKSFALRFVLAYLSNGIDRRAVDTFWTVATGAADRNSSDWFGRQQSLGNAYKYLHRQLGLEPPG